MIQNVTLNVSNNPPSMKQVQPTDSRCVPVRIGAVSYLNTKPLIFGLEKSIGVHNDLSLELPSRLATNLASGAIDIGLIPVIEYFQHPDFRIVSDAVIGCQGPVWSVRIFFRCDPFKVKTLALDEGSRTSAALSKVLFHARYGFVPNTIPLSMTDDPIKSSADAVLVIGDRAMHPETYRPAFQSDWDLGQIWYEETGLPFVFAMWVARNDSFATEQWRSTFEETRDEGLKHIREISTQAAGRYKLTLEQCQDYLTNYIRFFLRTEERAGLAEFRRRCESLGLVANETQRTQTW
jgi:chorismate dehydratase